MKSAAWTRSGGAGFEGSPAVDKETSADRPVSQGS